MLCCEDGKSKEGSVERRKKKEKDGEEYYKPQAKKTPVNEGMDLLVWGSA